MGLCDFRDPLLLDWPGTQVQSCCPGTGRQGAGTHEQATAKRVRVSLLLSSHHPSGLGTGAGLHGVRGQSLGKEAGPRGDRSYLPAIDLVQMQALRPRWWGTGLLGTEVLSPLAEGKGQAP